jgi:nucleotide-binding universal stress UspA family protein
VVRPLGYRSILVPLADNPETVKALDVACKLAVEHGAKLVAVAIVEVPPLLPLDAHMQAEEAEATRLIARARAIGDLYGVAVAGRVERARDAGEAVVSVARGCGCEVVVMGAPRRRGSRVFGRTTEVVLKRSPCRVMVVAAPAAAANAVRSAA